MEILKKNLLLFGRYIICQVFCLFLIISISTCFTLIGVEPIGYNAYVISGDEVSEEYIHYYSDGEDTKKAEYEAEGFIVKTQTITSELSGGPKIISLLLSLVCCLVFFFAFVPYQLYKNGKDDINKVSRGIISKDMFGGFKNAMLTSVVSLVSYVMLILGKIGIVSGGLSFYKITNCYLHGYIQLIFGDVTSASQIDVLGIVLAALPVILVPASCAVAYIIGIKDINFYDKIVLKK